MDKIEIDRELLQSVFDLAVGSMDFGSGFMVDDDVVALRAIAVLLGVDPMLGTPDGFKCKYGAPHDWVEPMNHRIRRNTRWCRTCKIEELA